MGFVLSNAGSHERLFLNRYNLEPLLSRLKSLIETKTLLIGENMDEKDAAVSGTLLRTLSATNLSKRLKMTPLSSTLAEIE